MVGEAKEALGNAGDKFLGAYYERFPDRIKYLAVPALVVSAHAVTGVGRAFAGDMDIETLKQVAERIPYFTVYETPSIPVFYGDIATFIAEKCKSGFVIVENPDGNTGWITEDDKVWGCFSEKGPDLNGDGFPDRVSLENGNSYEQTESFIERVPPDSHLKEGLYKAHNYEPIIREIYEDAAIS